MGAILGGGPGRRKADFFGAGAGGTEVGARPGRYILWEQQLEGVGYGEHAV
jgi:hypothetical protein